MTTLCVNDGFANTLLVMLLGMYLTYLELRCMLQNLRYFFLHSLDTFK